MECSRRWLSENIGDFQVKVVLPGNDNRLRTWLHGPLNGQIDPTNNGAEASYDFLGAYNAVSVRLTFNKSLVPTATKFSGMMQKMLSLIMKQSWLVLPMKKERELDNKII